jgi:transcriptional regulator with GAF, ATPase, and Fis domain
MAFQIHEQEKTQRKLVRLNSILRAIRNVNQLITRERDHDKLLKGICQVLVEGRGFSAAWIALFDQSQVVQMTAEAGLGDDFLPMRRLLKQGKLPICGRKALNKPDVVTTDDPVSICAGCPLAGTHNESWAMTVRLEHNGRVFGVMCVSAPEEQVDYKEGRPF